jgi:hypothetical protein
MALPPVRPQVWPPAQTSIQPGRNDARAAAQKAFFEAALGKAAAQPRPEPAPDRPTASAPQAVRSVAAAEARATDRLPPPGSIINILV